jgi:hypothetical protein
VTDHDLALDATTARLAAAAGVVMEALGLAAREAFDWLDDTSLLTGIPPADLADLVMRAAARDRTPSSLPRRDRADRRDRRPTMTGAHLARVDVVRWRGHPDGCR